MKISEQKLRLIVREEILKQEILKEESKHKLSFDERLRLKHEFDNLRTIGDLKKFIKRINSLIRAGVGVDGLKSVAGDAIKDAIPFGGTAVSLVNTVRKMYSLPDEKKISSNLDVLNVDDEVSKIVDDTIEDNFLIVALDQMTNSKNDNDPIPNMTKSLQKYIKGKYDNRTVDGFSDWNAASNLQTRWQMNIPRPYKEKRKNGNLVREFSSDSNPDDLIWHKDKQDRVVTVVKSNGWKLQMESGLPFDLTEGKNYKIPAFSWHRILKGRGNLLIKIKESNKNSLLQIFESEIV